MEVVKELKQHVGGFTGRLMCLWNKIAELGYSSGSSGENMTIVYDPDNKPVARIETRYTGIGDRIRIVSIFK